MFKRPMLFALLAYCCGCTDTVSTNKQDSFHWPPHLQSYRVTVISGGGGMVGYHAPRNDSFEVNDKAVTMLLDRDLLPEEERWISENPMRAVLARFFDRRVVFLFTEAQNPDARVSEMVLAEWTPEIRSSLTGRADRPLTLKHVISRYLAICNTGLRPNRDGVLFDYVIAITEKFVVVFPIPVENTAGFLENAGSRNGDAAR